MQYRIMAAVDLGPGAERVLAGAAQLAGATGAELHVRHVAEPHPRGAGPVVPHENARQGEVELLQLLVEKLGPDQQPASREIITGRRAAALVEAAQELGADLIVMGAHAGHDLSANLFGTTADRILRHVSTPCLIVRGPVVVEQGNVVIATDFSAASLTAATAGADLVRLLNSLSGQMTVDLVHVAWPAAANEDPRAIEEDIRERMEAARQAVVAGCGLDPSIHVLWSKQPSAALLEHASGTGAGMLVLGTTGRGGAASVMLGSIAAKVARHAEIPVLLVPAFAAVGRRAYRPRVENLLVGVDFSPASLAAVEWAATLAPEATATVLHVASVPEAPAYLDGGAALRASIRADLLKEARQRLERLASGAEQRAVEVCEGRPADELRSAAAARECDLIVIGGHTHPRGLWGVLGSTADELARTSAVPLLLVRGRPQGPPARVLACVDDSPHALDVLSWARLLTEMHQSDLHVIHVLSPRFIGAAQMVSGTSAAQEIEAAFRRQGENWTRDLLRQGGIDPGHVTMHIVHGDPIWEIVALQQRMAADLVLVGASGRGTVGRALLGSVSSGVVRGTTCAVLMVRRDE